MATVNLGSIKFKWKGTYSGATAYTIDDVVEYNGSSYICKLASTGNLPTNTTYFDVMSSAGTNGTNGTDLTTTLTTQGDILYRDGSGLQRLGAGVAGQALLTGGAGANPSWGAAGGTNTPFFLANLSSAQSISAATNTKVTFDSESVDAGGCFNNTSGTVTLNGLSVPSYSFAPNEAGYYYCTFYVAGSAESGYFGMAIKKNNSIMHYVSDGAANAAYVRGGSAVIYLDGLGNYIHCDIYTAPNYTLGAALATYFSAYKIIQ